MELPALDPVQIGFLVRSFTVLFAVGLAYIAFEGYRRGKRRVMLFVSLAFLAYLARDLIKLGEIAIPGSGSPLVSGVADILDLITLVLIFFAVARE